MVSYFNPDPTQNCTSCIHHHFLSTWICTSKVDIKSTGDDGERRGVQDMTSYHLFFCWRQMKADSNNVIQIIFVKCLIQMAEHYMTISSKWTVIKMTDSQTMQRVRHTCSTAEGSMASGVAFQSISFW